MDNSKKYLSIAFVVILVVVVIVSALGIWMLGRKPVILQGQIEATEIRISGKLPAGSILFGRRGAKRAEGRYAGGDQQSRGAGQIRTGERHGKHRRLPKPEDRRRHAQTDRRIGPPALE